jgi:predicted Zn-dependent protease
VSLYLSHIKIRVPFRARRGAKRGGWEGFPNARSAKGMYLYSSRSWIVRISAYMVVLWCALAANNASAQSLIRDAEIEQTLRTFSTPIFRSAGLTPENVHIFIINDPAINAFVAGGSNIFIHTGLMTETEDASMLIGVIAHETGHIAGGHIAGGTEQLENAQISTILSYVLGAAAGVAAGSSDAGAAIITAGQNVAQRNYLAFSRMNEQAADQAGINYLEQNNISVSGLLKVLEKLRRKETIYRGQLDPYALTHPLSKERISHIRGALMQSKIPAGSLPAGYALLHERLRAKLIGFLQKPETTLQQFPAGDNSLAARYARAVAYHRLSQTDNALVEMASLLKESPKDPFFLELKGQILVESGKPTEALPYYKIAAETLPDSALLKTEYASVLLAQTPPNYTVALPQLKQSSLQDSSNPLTWSLLADCYAANKESGQAALSIAEKELLSDRPLEALLQATIALKELPAASPARLRAEDIKTEATRLHEKERNG